MFAFVYVRALCARVYVRRERARLEKARAEKVAAKEAGEQRCTELQVRTPEFDVEVEVDIEVLLEKPAPRRWRPRRRGSRGALNSR
jgi:hypothetical protein